MKIINTDGLSETINMIASNIFIDPKEYQKQLKNIIDGPCGIANNLVKIFDEDIIYNYGSSNGIFFFEPDSYNKDFQKPIFDYYIDNS